VAGTSTSDQATGCAANAVQIATARV
jgi:hypothetical protein